MDTSIVEVKILEGSAMAKRPRAEDKAWGEHKSGRQFTLTETASDMIDRMAAETGNSRSELLERAVRWIDTHWDAQLKRDLSSSEGDRS